MELLTTIGIGLLIMLARMVDVTIGTIRVISVIDGRIKTAFMLGFIEVVVWLLVISLTLDKIGDNPLLAIFFALGFSLGNVVGIIVERRIPLGNLTLRVVGTEDVRVIATQIRELGLGATVLKGEGKTGERLMMFCFMPKSLLKDVMKILTPYRHEVFYTLDYGGTANKILLSASSRSAGPLRYLKRK